MLPAARGGVSVVEMVAAVLRRSLLLCSAVRTAEEENRAAAEGMQIGRPTDVRHVSRVTFDRFVGFLGLPADLEPEVPRPAPSARVVLRFCNCLPALQSLRKMVEGDLANGKLKEEEAHKYFQQLINAVDCCHSRGVYHRDFKTDGLLHTTCGTPNYVAPQVIEDRGYDGATADI